MSQTFNIGFLLFPNLTQLDFTGPLQVLSRLPGAKVHLVAKTLEPVQTDCGPFILPSITLEQCPDLDLICVPGGFGVDDAMRDPQTLAFLRRQGAQAKYITSVCTGAFILGAAGLLKGKRATTHWRYHSALADVGAIPEEARVVRDGNVFTGGGVTAGIDFAFTVLKELGGETLAEAVQLGLEYDPMPPVDAGSPGKASEPVRAAVEDRFAPRIAEFRQALREVAIPS
ncbi:DJ-1/PfpI family protein [Maricaulis sp.]|uniref:DJ-1/PfpI family protein n=1 Tax=Maricaulis sp. TaxID=1486257 RepID=UPI002611F860|nr:DJ-1/PfpI family protein [Maricaulis sp.]